MSWTLGPSEGVPDPDPDPAPDPEPGPDDRDWVAMSRRVAATAEAKSASRSTVSGRTERISAMPWHNGHSLQATGVPSLTPPQALQTGGAPGSGSPVGAPTGDAGS